MANQKGMILMRNCGDRMLHRYRERGKCEDRDKDRGVKREVGLL